MTIYYIEKTYFKEDEKNKDEFITETRIEVFNKDKSIVETIQKARDDLKDLEIQETEEEIINWKGENVFKKYVETDFINDLRNKKIEQLGINCKTFILNKYPETTQLNIIAQNEYTEEDLKTYKEFVAKYRAEYHDRKEQLEQATTEEEIEAMNIEFKQETKKTTKKKNTTTNKETI